MKLSDTGQGAVGAGFLSNGPIYSLLAIYMPLAVLIALVFLLRGLLPIIPVPLLISGVISALVASLYCDFMKDVKSSRTAANIRSVSVTLLISYVFSSLCRWGIPLKERFVPDLSTIMAFLGTLYVWVSVISLKHLFSTRKRFEAYTELYREEQLHKALFDDADLLQNIDKEIFTTQRNYLIQFVLIVIILLVNTAYKIPLSPALYFLLTGILASGICIFGFFGIIRQEHYCAARGISLSAIDRSKHILGIGIFSVFSIIAAVLLSSDKSLLPFSLIIGFLNWFLALINWFVGMVFTLFALLWGLIWGLFAGDSGTEPKPMELERPSFSFEQTEESGPSPIWTWLKYGAIVLVAAAFVWFLISPLLSRDGIPSGKLTFFRKLRRIIEEWFRGVVVGLVSFFALIREGDATRKIRRFFNRKPSTEEIQRMAGAILGAYSQAKKREVKQSVTLFARLIIWGGEVRQVMWKSTHAPGEYCCLLAASVPEMPLAEDSGSGQSGEAIVRCGELFEKALYSAEVLSDDEREEFKELVEKITSQVC
jgi:hypothetical protein